MLTKKEWSSTVTDCQSRIDLCFDSDHFLLEANIDIKLKATPTTKGGKVKKFTKPDQGTWESYNQAVRDELGVGEVDYTNLCRSIASAADLHLSPVNPEIKKPYISNSTWQLIQDRNLAWNTAHTNKQMKTMNNKISNEAKKDKKNHTIEKFNENPADKNKKNLWRAVKDMKRKYTPSYIKMKNKDGIHVPLNKRAEAIADYLEKEHWTNDENGDMPNNQHIGNSNIHCDDQPFAIEELNEAIKLSKNNKQPGPDNITMELLKWLDHENRNLLLILFNKWWIHQNAPPEVFLARVVPIFKKGDTDNASNYRPISLLSSFYKLYMILIRFRIQKAVEHALCETQYGFRQGKSTSHAIYLIRRIQDYAELKGSELSMALLDWEKAFDKVQHDRLYIAMEKIGLSRKIVDVIKNCYSSPTFYVQDDFGKSDIKTQKSGIRQGCPLSPYLFIIVMTCIDEDIKSLSSPLIEEHRIPGIEFDMVYYADDTILFSQSPEAVSELLKHTENASIKYGLKLNRNKCVAITMNNEEDIIFQNGDSLKNSFETTYLGNEINKRVNIKLEISAKMHEVRKTWYKLVTYWKATNASKKWQLIIYDAIIRSKLLYGLETVYITEDQQKKLNAFQMRGIRTILKKQSTFMDRSNTNARLLEEASMLAFGQGSHRKITLFSEFYANRRAKLLGHVIRASIGDPLRQVTLEPFTATRPSYGKKRVGKPRHNWTRETKSYVWTHKLNKRSAYLETAAQDNLIQDAAILRTF